MKIGTVIWVALALIVLLYGTVAVFKDLYGNLWDLLEPKASHANADA